MLYLDQVENPVLLRCQGPVTAFNKNKQYKTGKKSEHSYELNENEDIEKELKIIKINIQAKNSIQNIIFVKREHVAVNKK